MEPRKLTFIFRLVLFLSCCVTASVTAEAATWLYYGSSADGNYYYDVSQATKPQKDVVKVWYKVVYSQPAIQLWKSNAGDKYADIQYSTNFTELDCSSRRVRLISAHDYDSKGGELGGATYKNPPWRDIPPGSMMTPLLEKVCQTTSKR